MPATRISDIIIPEVFNPYVTVRTAEMAKFAMGPIIANDADLNALAVRGGTIIKMPFFNDLTGDSEILSDTTPLSVNKITTGQDWARLHLRGKAWGSNDLAGALAGADPMAAIGDLVAAYWQRDQEKILIATLNGVIADNIASDAGDMVHDVSIADGNAAADANLFSAESLIDTALTAGDRLDDFVGFAVHTVVYGRMLKGDLIEFIPDSEGKLTIPTYMGKRIIFSDRMPVVAGGVSGFVYTSCLFGDGAVALGQGGAPVPTETDRDSLQGDDILINRQHFVMHPRGVKWDEGAVAGESPSNAELENAANWSRVYERKLVRLAFLRTNG